ncbi:MAG: hypothetical protein QXU18_16280, partial [Thermoplasmatales archaeon]
MSQLSINYHQGEYAVVSFNLQSNYIPLFTTPTIGELSLSSSAEGSMGYIAVSNATENVGSGGVLSVLTNNRYFVDEAYSYVFSTIFYEQAGSIPLINTTLQSNLLQIDPPANGSINLSMNLFNLIGGPFNVSSQSPFSLGLTAQSKVSFVLMGNITIGCSSTGGEALYTLIDQELSPLHYLLVTQTTGGAGFMHIFIHSVSIPIVLYITELNVIVSVNG